MCCIVRTYPPDHRNGAEDRPEDAKNGSSSAEDGGSILRRRIGWRMHRAGYPPSHCGCSKRKYLTYNETAQKGIRLTLFTFALMMICAASLRLRPPMNLAARGMGTSARGFGIFFRLFPILLSSMNRVFSSFVIDNLSIRKILSMLDSARALRNVKKNKWKKLMEYRPHIYILPSSHLK